MPKTPVTARQLGSWLLLADPAPVAVRPGGSPWMLTDDTRKVRLRHSEDLLATLLRALDDAEAHYTSGFRQLTGVPPITRP